MDLLFRGTRIGIFRAGAERACHGVAGFNGQYAENGCVRVIPGTHRGEIYSHVETYDDKNLLARGQSIEDIDDLMPWTLFSRPGSFPVTTNASCMVQMLMTQIGCGSVGHFISQRTSVPPSDVPASQSRC